MTIFLFQNGGRPPCWIWPNRLIDHPRWRLGGLKWPVKFRIDLTHCFEDIENSIFLKFGLKSPNHAHFLGVYGVLIP